jgi:hypothetical protein
MSTVAAVLKRTEAAVPARRELLLVLSRADLEATTSTIKATLHPTPTSQS